MTWEQWLEALYRTHQIYLADYILEQGWHEKVLQEHQRLSDHIEGLMNLYDHLSDIDAPSEETASSITKKQGQLQLLLSVLRYCYPECRICRVGMSFAHSEGNNCYYGLDTTRPS